MRRAPACRTSWRVKFEQKSMSTQGSTTVHRSIARRIFVAILLICVLRGTTCVASDHVSCAMPVEPCESSDDCSCGQSCECQPGASDRGRTAEKHCCCCCRILRPICKCVEPIVCWPVHKICHFVNFCAPDGFVGPPDVMGPGRFHPVPTRPVFEPGPQQIVYPQPSAE
jgi:hypothetical protein